jgi:hypothetical protein
MINSFDTDVAIDVGVNAAIIYRNIQYWCEKNRANEQNFHDGYYWTYNSISAFCKQFPYLTKRQVEIALKTLEDKGYVKSGNFNKVAYDRTKWYADAKCEMEHTEKVKCISHTGEIDFASMQNGIHTEGEPIPNNYTNINTDKGNIYIEDTEPKPKRFVPPTVEEVSDYCSERNNNIDAQKFVDYYSSNGWKVGKNPMKDWKACVRTWERNDYGKPIGRNPKPQAQNDGLNEFGRMLIEEGYA